MTLGLTPVSWAQNRPLVHWVPGILAVQPGPSEDALDGGFDGSIERAVSAGVDAVCESFEDGLGTQGKVGADTGGVGVELPVTAYAVCDDRFGLLGNCVAENQEMRFLPHSEQMLPILLPTHS